ncbi:hypothetical protein D9M68_758090 [compost metagenome]
MAVVAAKNLIIFFAQRALAASCAPINYFGIATVLSLGSPYPSIKPDLLEYLGRLVIEWGDALEIEILVAV